MNGTRAAILPRTLLAEGIRRAVLDFLVKHEALADEFRSRMLAWRHAGFSAHSEVRLTAEDAEGRTKLAGYMLRAPMSFEKMTYDADTGITFVRRATSTRSALLPLPVRAS